MAGVDLDLFRFDYDLTLAIFFLDGNDRIYSRYGGRDAGPADARLSKDSLAHTMRSVLDLHRKEWTEPDGRDRRPEPKETIEKLPAMARRIAGGKQPECFHCHMVADSRRQTLIETGRFDKRKIWDYPLPENLGLTFDRDRGTLLSAVEPKSPASRAGIRAGDTIAGIEGRRVLSEGDVRWALHNFSGRRLSIEARRGDEVKTARLSLPKNWRVSDISWRESMYQIPPKPGFWAPALNDEQKSALGIPKDSLALRVQWVPGQPARKAGLRKGMTIVALDGFRKHQTPQQVHLYIRLEKEPGDTLVLTVLDRGRQRDLRIQFPKSTRDF